MNDGLRTVSWAYVTVKLTALMGIDNNLMRRPTMNYTGQHRQERDTPRCDCDPEPVGPGIRVHHQYHSDACAMIQERWQRLHYGQGGTR